MSEVWAARQWANNGEMIAEVFSLHVKNPDAVVVDPTYGEGTFWSVIEPKNLIAHDKLSGPRKDGVDWGDLPEADESVDVVVFDPPYVARGGRKTSTIPGMVGAYGMDSAQHSPEALWTDILRGIDEAFRVLKPRAKGYPGGLLMLKVMPYISSAHLQNVLRWAFEAVDDNEMILHDWFVFVGKPGPQPKSDKCRECIDGTVRVWIYNDATARIGHYEDAPCPTCAGEGKKSRPQQHSRNNASHLLVARKKAKRGRKT